MLGSHEEAHVTLLFIAKLMNLDMTKLYTSLHKIMLHPAAQPDLKHIVYLVYIYRYAPTCSPTDLISQLQIYILNLNLKW